MRALGGDVVDYVTLLPLRYRGPFDLDYVDGAVNKVKKPHSTSAQSAAVELYD